MHARACFPVHVDSEGLPLAQAPISLQAGATFEDYLAMEPEEDSVRETYIDPMTLRGPAGAHEVC